MPRYIARIEDAYVPSKRNLQHPQAFVEAWFVVGIAANLGFPSIASRTIAFLLILAVDYDIFSHACAVTHQTDAVGPAALTSTTAHRHRVIITTAAVVTSHIITHHHHHLPSYPLRRDYSMQHAR
jgi:hypothetical protein